MLFFRLTCIFRNWQDLVNGLNAATAPGTYAFRVVPGRNGDGVVGTDVISVKFLYKPATFEPVRLQETERLQTKDLGVSA